MLLMKSEEGYLLQTYVNCKQQTFFLSKFGAQKHQNGLGQTKVKI